MPCYTIYDKQRRPVGHIYGKLGPHCAECGDVGTNLCDYVVGARSKTCDRPLCDYCAHEVGHNRHYCAEHYALGTGVQLELIGGDHD
jgi:hypothetical protein